MATEEYRKKIALLDWQNEKEHKEKILSDPSVSEKDKLNAIERIKEANKWIERLSK